MTEQATATANNLHLAIATVAIIDSAVAVITAPAVATAEVSDNG